MLTCLFYDVAGFFDESLKKMEVICSNNLVLYSPWFLVCYFSLALSLPLSLSLFYLSFYLCLFLVPYPCQTRGAYITERLFLQVQIEVYYLFSIITFPIFNFFNFLKTSHYFKFLLSRLFWLFKLLLILKSL